MTKKILFLITVLLIVLIAFYALIPVINKSLGYPDLSKVTLYEPISSVELYDYKDNFVGYLQAKEDRKVVSLEEMSPNIKRAVLAIEDKDFYDHFGINPFAILRAALVNLRAGKVVEGGSTITQQLVKNLIIPEEERGRTFTRKFKEFLLALELEQKISKDKIIELYLNQVYLGNRAYGIERASQRYFRKKAKDLTVGEAAFLAGLLKAPSALALNREAAVERQKLVLNKMYQFGFINKKQLEEELSKELDFRSDPGNLELYPFYFSYVMDELSKHLDVTKLKNKGYKIFTSLDPELQYQAEKILNEEIKNAPNGVTQFAFAGIDVDTAQIRTIVGGVGDFWKHQWNRATNPHTIGSAFKPFVYLTGFQEGIIDPETIIKDSEIEIDDGSEELWIPKNFDDKFWGEITIRRALTFSRNLPSVKIAHRVGIEKVIETARACGVKSELQPNLSLSLGSAALSPLEAANAYSTFARGGVYIEPILIRRIEDAKGRVIEKNDPVPRRVANKYAAASLVDILEDVVSMGTGTLARLPERQVGGKTGTSDKSRDVWFLGFTSDFSAAIWGGNDDYKPIHGKHVTGGAIVARVWKKIMEKYYETNMIESRDFASPPEMKEYLIDPLTGLLATPYTPHPVKRRFYPGTAPKEYAPVPMGAKKFGPLLRFIYGPVRKNKFIEKEEYEKRAKGKRYVKKSLSPEEKDELLRRAQLKLNLLDGDPTNDVIIEEDTVDLENPVLEQVKPEKPAEVQPVPKSIQQVPVEAQMVLREQLKTRSERLMLEEQDVPPEVPEPVEY